MLLHFFCLLRSLLDILIHHIWVHILKSTLLNFPFSSPMLSPFSIFCSFCSSLMESCEILPAFVGLQPSVRVLNSRNNRCCFWLALLKLGSFGLHQLRTLLANAVLVPTNIFTEAIVALQQR